MLSRKSQTLLFCLAVFLIASGFTRPGTSSGKELRPEIRLKFVEQALDHYKKAREYYAQGNKKEALRELSRAVKSHSAFPEAHRLAVRIYEETGEPEKAAKSQKLFLKNRGRSPERLRKEILEEIRREKENAPPPDFEAGPAMLSAAALFILSVAGLILESRRLIRELKNPLENNPLIVAPFPGEERPAGVEPSTRFKLLAVFLPGPFIFGLTVLFGVQHWKVLLPLLGFGWAVAAAAVYIAFFEDLSNLSRGFGRKKA